MFTILLALPLVLLRPEAVLQGDGEASSTPDPALVQAALADLRTAFKSGVDGRIVASIQRHAQVASPEVVASIAGGLEHPKSGVRRTAVEALRTSPLDDARIALEHCWTKGERLKGDLDLRERVLKAIANREDHRSIELLADFPEPAEDASEPEPVEPVEPIEIVRARIRGLGRIRDERALHALMDVFTAFDEDRQRDLLPEFRLSLLVLTGVDHGTNLKRWLDWWEEHRAVALVLEEPPLLLVDDRGEWYGYWGLPIYSHPDDPQHPRGGG